MAEGEVRRYWVRDTAGNTRGPLPVVTLGRLVSTGQLAGPLHVSLDGQDFQPAGLVPEVRDALPPESWGEDAAAIPTPPPAAPAAIPPPPAAPAAVVAPPPPPTAAVVAPPPPPAGLAPPVLGTAPLAPPPPVTAPPPSAPRAPAPPAGAPPASPAAARPPGAPPPGAPAAARPPGPPAPPPGSTSAPTPAAPLRPPVASPGSPLGAAPRPPGPSGAPPPAGGPGAPAAPSARPGMPASAAGTSQAPVSTSSPPAAPGGAPRPATAQGPAAAPATAPAAAAPATTQRPSAAPAPAPPAAAPAPAGLVRPGAPAPAPRPGPPPAGAAAAPQAGPGTRAPAAAARPGPPVLHQVDPSAPRPAPTAPPASAAAAAPATSAPPPPATPAAPPPPAQAQPVALTAEGEPVPPVPAEGDLTQVPFLRLYGLAAAGGRTGLLRLTLPDCVVEVHFRKGNPEHVRSSHPEDALGPFLVDQRLLTPAQLAQAEDAAPRMGGELVGALFALGLLQPAVAFPLLAQRATLLLGRALLAESGRFTFELRELPAHLSMPLGNRWGVVSDLMRRIPSPELRRRLAPVLDLPVMKAGGLVAPTELRLTPQEVRALAVIDGVRSVSALLRDFPQDTDHFLRLVFLLKDLEAVSFAAVPQRPQAAAAPPPPPPPAAAAPRPAAPPPAPAGAPPRPAAAPAAAAPPRPAPAPPPARAPAPAAAAAPARPTPPAPPPPPPENDRATLEALALKLKAQNLFERLGVGEKTTGAEVKAAYFRLAKAYHPDTLPQDATPELAKVKADVFALIGEAYRRLSEDASRADYIEELKSGGAADVDVQALIHAEELFNRATLLVKARKFPEALKTLDEAIGLNPDEAEFYAWRGYARFFLVEDKKAAAVEARTDLQRCLKMNEKCAPAHYFLGQVAKLSGDATAALTHFRRTVELNPHHIDAAREIRLAQQQQKK